MISEKEARALTALAILGDVISPIYPNFVLKRVIKKGVIEKISPDVSNGRYDISNYLNHGKFNQIISEFNDTLVKKLPHCNNAFAKNLETLKIIEKQKSFIDKAADRQEKYVVMSDYQPLKDKLTIYESAHSKKLQNHNRNKITNHELVHIASTYKKGRIIMSGFSQIIGTSYQVGIGLNEGYTERINLKYFSKGATNPSYPTLRCISECIEKIVGEEKMEQLFFEGNLAGLVGELENYYPKEAVICLIQKIDKCHSYIGKDIAREKSLAKEIRAEIGNIYIKQQEKLLAEGKISKAEFQSNIVSMGFLIKEASYKEEQDEIVYKSHYDGAEKSIPIAAARVIKNTFFKNHIEPLIFSLTDTEQNHYDIVSCTESLEDALNAGFDPNIIDHMIPQTKEPLSFTYVLTEEEKQRRNTETQTKKELDSMFCQSKSNIPQDTFKK